jgi:hypothetical protein
MKNVAVLINATSGKAVEPFIQNHIDKLPFNIIIFYGGILPNRCNGFKESELVKAYFKLCDFITKKSTL